ncbi:SDR family NAD(P)-dependent oxidoreductase [Corallococcus sp. ZKHCc1 1396]|uniref:SDR family NAD(P)-dependent oxidoreductase n=1 Tax=Corallococcus soli TaxID=2710757 RepID=A0ABR9PM12_9BACT|nr:SDR family NAD(P)-dependent oxidoreductase [Corallococcus soli]MBE4748945.1 SDR family NAD(P)-dependent oxidoreductase [Corallococcus soli]
MALETLVSVRDAVVSALVQGVGYPPELFSPDVELVNDLGMTPAEINDAVAAAERKLGIPPDMALPPEQHTTLNTIAQGLLKNLHREEPPASGRKVTLAQVLAFVDACALRKERPPLETLLTETTAALARMDAATKPVAPVAPSPSTDVMTLLTQALVERTGYPVDMLEPDLDLEADLGIDTVKQVEAFAQARVHLNVDKDENFRLRDFNTLRKMVDYLVGRASKGVTAIAVAPVLVAPAAVSTTPMLETLRAAMAEKTGYAPDILQPDLDLEVDLGIDTITQIEVFAAVRTNAGVERDESFRVRYHNTLRKMAAYLEGRASGSTTVITAPAPAVVAAPSPVAAPSSQADDVTRMLVTALVERTGYPQGMLELDLDLEADLGIDTVKQVEAFALVRVHLGVEKDENFRLRDHNTLRKMVAYLVKQAAPPASVPAVTPPAPMVAPATTGLTPEAVRKQLVDALVERTGYPEDMLEPDLDLEADLGIDTVKQVEAFALVRVHLGVEKDEDFRLRDHNTLHKMVTYLVGRSAVGSARPAEGASEEKVLAFLSNAFQEKTGYNIEVLGPDFDLEVDLGIDTITQIEAFAMARAAFGVPKDEGFRVRDHNTLRKLAAYLVRQLPSAEKAAPRPAVPDALDLDAVRQFVAQCEASGDVESLKQLATHLRGKLEAPANPLTPPARFSAKRYEVHPVEESSQPRSEHVAHLRGKTLGITPDAHGAYKQLAQRLESAGARVVILPTGPVSSGAVTLDWKQPEVAGQRLRELQATQPLDGLILLHTTTAPPVLAGMEAGAWTSTVNAFTLGLYYSALSVYDRIGSMAGGGWYLVATAGGGLFGHDKSHQRVPLAGAAGGFVKCLKRELPDARCKVVDLDPRESAAWVEQLWTELTGGDQDVETAYSGGRRYVFRDIETPLVTDTTAMSIKPGSVVLVSGGGRGVVYHCAKLLAQVTGARVIITGRTVPPNGNEEWLTVADKDLPAYRMGFVKRYMAAHPGATPVQGMRAFDSDIARRRELHRNLEDCRSLGIRLDYKVCDMTEPAAVRGLLAEVRQQYGRIDGIVHGATIEESKSLPMKSAEVVVRTLASKAHLWQLLAQETWKDELQFFINFGSGSGRYGNQGQTDYSAANALVAKAGLVYGALRPGVRSVTIDWPVWVGAGIVENNRDYLERLGQAGVCVIDLAEGAYWFVGELLHGGPAGEVVIADDTTFASRGWPRHEKGALQVTAREAGGTRYAI